MLSHWYSAPSFQLLFFGGGGTFCCQHRPGLAGRKCTVYIVWLHELWVADDMKRRCSRHKQNDGIIIVSIIYKQKMGSCCNAKLSVQNKKVLHPYETCSFLFLVCNLVCDCCQGWMTWCLKNELIALSPANHNDYLRTDWKTRRHIHTLYTLF